MAQAIGLFFGRAVGSAPTGFVAIVAPRRRDKVVPKGSGKRAVRIPSQIVWPTPVIRFEGHDLACLRGERLVFAHLDFALDAGDALVLTGRNGSGKTSLLRLVSGLAPPATGRLLWNDGPVAAEPARHRARILYVGHQDAVKPALSVSENLTAWAALRGSDPVRARRALAAFGLDALADLPARYLSAGQRRRLALSRLLAVDAPLWLLDEPTIALDREAAAALHDALARHRDGGGMAIIATNVDLAIPAAATLAVDGFAPVDDMALFG